METSSNSFFVPRSVNFLKGKYFVPALVFVLLLMPEIANAQCAMCRAVLESEGNTSAAEGINNGIVYLMALPYLLVAGVFFVIYQKMKPKVKNNPDTSN